MKIHWSVGIQFFNHWGPKFVKEVSAEIAKNGIVMHSVCLKIGCASVFVKWIKEGERV